MEETLDSPVITYLKCFVCGEANSSVKKFKEATLKKCLYSRRCHIHYDLHYQDKTVPQGTDEGLGYHSACYSNFNALNEKYRLPKEEPSKSAVSGDICEDSVNSSIGDQGENPPEDESSGDEPEPLMEKETLSTSCFFCPVKEKRKRGRKDSLVATRDYSRFKIIKKYATQQEELPVLEKLAAIEKNNEVLVYHSSCSNEYKTKFENAQKKKGPDTAWNIIREKRAKAFLNFRDFIFCNIVENGKSYFYSFLQTIFVQCLYEELDKSAEEVPNAFSVEQLKEQILNDKELTAHVKFFRISEKWVLGPITADLENFDFQAIIQQDIVQRAAILIRQEILAIKKINMPQELTATALIRGECEVPPNLETFYKYLLSGGSWRRKKSASFKTKSQSLAEDAIYNVTNGRVKPSKHITLGMAMKSLTSTKVVVDILNSFGHCCSYTTLLGLETEATYTCVQSAQTCPHDIRKAPGLNTGLAYDNFDRFVETLDGKDTLHDTVGIIYQDIYVPPNQEAGPSDSNLGTEIPAIMGPERQDGDSEGTTTKRRRRTFEALECSLEPYNKRPKTERTLKCLDFHMLNSSEPVNYPDLKNMYTAWIFSFFMGIQTPMWVGFNSQIIEDHCKKQIISYLTPLNASPTDDSVVMETLKQAQRVAKECKENYAQVTYDLAVAIKALNIQKRLPSRFSNVFIHLGAFHIMMSYFKALGKFIDGSGITDILVDSGILANGSVSSFLSGKHFHRGKRLHPLIAASFEVIHFTHFLQSEEDLSTSIRNNKDDVIKYLKTFQNTTSATPRVDNELVLQILTKYQEFREKTVEGRHGKTGQFCMIYATLVSHYIDLTTAIRTGDYDLFVYILPKICNLLFSFNHQNYSRWLVQYHDNLLSVDETHPGLIESFRAGSFGIKRTDKPFSKNPVDLTLEQTINADAARCLTGISHFTNSLSARQRWSISHGVRTSILSYIYDLTGVKRKQDVSKDLMPNRIKKDNNHLFKFIDGINERLNPFSPCLQENKLYHLSTGATAPDNIANFLLNILENGVQLRNFFIKECISDDKNARFDKAIKRVAVENFASLKTKKKIQVGKKVQEVTIQRDLFGRLLAIALENKIDLQVVMKYPITPVPTVFCHIHGLLHKTDKSVLVKTLENELGDSFAPNIIDQYIVDGFFFLHFLKNAHRTFGQMSLQILEMLCSLKSRRIDIVFDTYPEPSIKDHEHQLRENLSSYDGVIKEHLTLRTSTFSAHLKDTTFKIKFVEFLSEHWTCREAGRIIGDKIINLNFKECYSYKTSLDQVVRTENYDLSCENHEEADTKIIYHACKSKKKIVIKCSDSDILIILLGNMFKLDKSAQVWLEMGVGTKRRFINASKLYEKLGPDLARSLPAFHAFTGCDFNPCFHQKGKKRPFNLLKNSQEFQKAFYLMASQEIIRDRTVYNKTSATIQKFVCMMYGFKNSTDVNESRLAVFSATYTPKKSSEKLLKDLYRYDSSRLPPCQAELEQQFKRTIYIARVWSGAHRRVPTDLEPSDWGWVLENGKFGFRWYDGNALPADVQDIIIPENGTARVSADSHDESPEVSDSEREDFSGDDEDWDDEDEDDEDEDDKDEDDEDEDDE